MQVRSAQPEEAELIYQFIQHKAEFDRSVGAYTGQIQTTVAKIRETIFSDRPFAHVLLVERGLAAIGFALYGFRYSSFVGQPSIWLDDLYVEPARRSNGAGTLLMRELQQIARQNKCSHLAWTADARNTRGLKFYEGLDAEIIQQQENRCFWRWNVS